MKRNVLSKLSVLVLSLALLAQGPIAEAAEIWLTPSEFVSTETNRNLIEKPREALKDFELVNTFENLLSHPITHDQLERLMNKEARALDLYYSGAFEDSLNQFQSLCHELFGVPNGAGVRKMTVHCLQRQAEIKTILSKPDAKKSWLAAYAWAPNTELSPKEFSPQIQKIWKSLFKANQKVRVKFKTHRFAKLFVDGKILPHADGAKDILLFPGLHQVSALAPGSQWLTKTFEVTSASQNMTVSASPRLIAQGSCENPVIDSEIGAKKKWLVSYPGDCDRLFDGKIWFTPEGKKVESQDTAYFAPKTVQAKPESWFSRVEKSPVFWVVLGIAAVGAAYAVKTSFDVENVPTHAMR